MDGDNEFGSYEDLVDDFSSETLPIKQLVPGMDHPMFAHSSDAGLDLRSAEPTFKLLGGQQKSVSTGIAVDIQRYADSAGTGPLFGMVTIRSSVARSGISLANGVGIIDAGYQGMIVLLLNNNTLEPVTIEKNSRVAQMILVPCFIPTIKIVEEFECPTERGTGGFGSSGKF